MSTAQICLIEPFRYQATPQTIGDQGASANQINEQAMEDYLNRMRTALCEDIQALIDGAGGATTFLELTDTPNSYVGAGGEYVAVKVTEDGLEFVAPPAAPEQFITEKMICYVKPNANGAGSLLIGNGQTATAGTLNPNIGGTSTNFRTQFPRMSFSTSAAINQVGLWRSTTLLAYRGDAAGRGGFTFKVRFASATAGATQRHFVGLKNGAGAIGGTTQPSSLTNIIAMATDAGDANWSIMHNDGAGTATIVPLGANFPVSTTTVYELEFSCLPNANSVSYTVTNLETGATTSGSLTTELPASNLFFEPQVMVGNAGTAATNTIELIFLLLEHAT